MAPHIASRDVQARPTRRTRASSTADRCSTSRRRRCHVMPRDAMWCHIAARRLAAAGARAAAQERSSARARSSRGRRVSWECGARRSGRVPGSAARRSGRRVGSARRGGAAAAARARAGATGRWRPRDGSDGSEGAMTTTISTFPSPLHTWFQDSPVARPSSPAARRARARRARRARSLARRLPTTTIRIRMILDFDFGCFAVLRHHDRGVHEGLHR